ncbi:MAG: CHASE2 domain-containing protein, partial [Silvanigrellaceae bacterium]|nr:CHASE2 domain-containing protein [Silvanigrellaceae bacterium]
MNAVDSSAKQSKRFKSFIGRFFYPTPFKLGIFIMLCSITMLLRHYNLSHQSIDIIGEIERKILDLRFKLRGEMPLSGKVGVLAADDASIEEFGRWPFPRGIYEQAFKNLKARGVKWLGFDVFFSES